MPREYRQDTPGGDPSNPLSLMTTTMDIQQVSFTPQTAVAEPENQFVMLERILGLGSQVATNAYQYAAQANENEMALNAAIYRERQRQTENAEIDIKKNQDAIFKRFDAEITASLLVDDYEGARDRAKLMAEMYPVNENPDGNLKAQDHLLRVKVAEGVYLSKLEQKQRQDSAAIQGQALFDSMSRLETVQGAFNNPETRPNVIDMFGPKPPSPENPNGTPGVPDDQLHVAINDMLMAAIPQAKLPLLTLEDKVELQTTLLRQSDSLRTAIITERNKQRTFARIEQRTNAAIAIASSMNKPTEDLETLFTEFEQLEADKQAGLISPVQQTNLERNLVNIMADNLGKESPVSGALAMKQRITEGINEGRIPTNRGLRIISLLERRASQELESQIQQIEENSKIGLTAEDQPNSLALSNETDPSLEMGFNYGIYTMDSEGKITVRPGSERLAGKLQELSAKWISQKNKIARDTGLETTIDFVANSAMVQQEYTAVLERAATTPNVNPVAEVDSLMFRELMSAYSYPKEPEKREAHTLTTYRVVKAELERTKDVAVTPEVQAELDELNGLVATNPVAAEKKIRDLVGNYMSTPEDKRTPEQRKKVYLALESVMDRTLTPRQKETARKPESMMDDYGPEEYVTIANNYSTRLYKNKDKMSQVEREIEEDKTARFISAGDAAPVDWFKYLGEQYFVPGASPAQLKRGFDLLSTSKTYMQDDLGNRYNFPTMGSIQAELALYEANPLMYDTLALAEGFSIGTSQPSTFFLQESHNIAVRRQQVLEATKDRIGKGTEELLPPITYDYASGLPATANTLSKTRQKELRQAFKDVFSYDVPEQSESDISLVLDPEDYNRMNAMYQGFKARGYNVEQSMRMALGKMKMFGYNPIPGQPGSTEPRVQMVFDPFSVIPPQSSQNSPEFGGYLSDLVGQAVRAGKVPAMVSPTTQGNTVSLRYNNTDLGKENAKISFVIMRPNGEVIYMPEEFGVSDKDFREWKRRTRLKADADRPGI